MLLRHTSMICQIFYLTILISIKGSLGTLTCPNKQVEGGCTGTNVKLQCPEGNVLRIMNAEYGNIPGTNYCWNNRVSSAEECVSESALFFVRKTCNQKQICKIGVNENELGQPICKSPQERYSLQITYECVPTCQMTTVSCQEDEMVLQCSNDCRIWVLSAMFGRNVNEAHCKKVPLKLAPTCVLPHCFDGCESSDSVLQYVEQKCNTKSQCRVRASEKELGPSCNKIYKYLSVGYQCLPMNWFDRYTRNATCS